MNSIKEQSHKIGWVDSKHYDPMACKQEWCEMAARASANYVLDEIEKELKRRMLEDYNQGMKEDEIAQVCMASMIEFIEQLKK